MRKQIPKSEMANGVNRHLSTEDTRVGRSSTAFVIGNCKFTTVRELHTTAGLQDWKEKLPSPQHAWGTWGTGASSWLRAADGHCSAGRLLGGSLQGITTFSGDSGCLRDGRETTSTRNLRPISGSSFPNRPNLPGVLQ